MEGKRLLNVLENFPARDLMIQAFGAVSGGSWRLLSPIVLVFFLVYWDSDARVNHLGDVGQVVDVHLLTFIHLKKE